VPERNAVGLFFDNRAPSTELVDLMRRALEAEPPSAPDETQQQAEWLASHLPPLTRSLTTALASPPPASAAASAADAASSAQATVNQLLGGPSFNSGRFVIALAIFAALVGGGIATEATHLTTAAGTLFGFAGAVFGIVTAFLGSEKGSS
jgi:hypothetical protein